MLMYAIVDLLIEGLEPTTTGCQQFWPEFISSAYGHTAGFYTVPFIWIR